ncbi:hypothetical protein Ae201684P_013205 [Aphanomyces euteiches]|nr:hypothetical protein Ae201684P_008122 [Aphanomyces euteiches]KAH9096537.1 hypothetical protein Ae201684P_013205 [Aphanomyces euteiches]
MMILRVRAYFLNEAAKPSREKKKKVRRVVLKSYSRIGVMLTEETDDMLGMHDPDYTESVSDTKGCWFG